MVCSLTVFLRQRRAPLLGGAAMDDDGGRASALQQFGDLRHVDLASGRAQAHLGLSAVHVRLQTLNPLPLSAHSGVYHVTSQNLGTLKTLEKP